MINPAQYQQVLQKMPDPQLMQLLKRPDKIPSQFVIQEINRRKQMRQAEEARKKQVANAVAMQQQPVQTTTPEGQPAMGLLHGGPPPHPPINPTLLNELNKFKNPPSFAQFGFPYENFQGNIKSSDIGSFNLANIGKKPKRNIPYFTSSPQDELSVKVAKAGFNPMSIKGMSAYYAQQDPLEDLLTEKSDTGTSNTSGIQTIDTTNQNEEIVVTEEPKLTEKMDATPNNFFANSIDAINKQIKETNNKFGVEQLQKGKEGLLQFNELSEAFKGLEEKGQKRVTDFNADSKALLDERRKLISKLEAGGRSPSSIVYESLINMGLNLMASPEANFTQALGQAGQAGFATFQNLRKEEKERVKDLHKMSYDLAVKEFEHKQKADEIANAYDLKYLDGKSVLLNAKLQMAEQERKGVKTAADIGFMGDQIRQGDLKLALQSAQNDIQMFNANINKFKAENDAIYKNQLTELEKIKVDSNKSIFNRIFDVESKNPDNKDESDVLNSTITRYALTQADSVKDENVKKDLIEKAIPTLFGSFDPEQARLDEEYTRNFIMQANKIIDSLVKAEGGLTLTEEKLDEILASYGQK